MIRSCIILLLLRFIYLFFSDLNWLNNLNISSRTRVFLCNPFVIQLFLRVMRNARLFSLVALFLTAFAGYFLIFITVCCIFVLLLLLMSSETSRLIYYAPNKIGNALIVQETAFLLGITATVVVLFLTYVYSCFEKGCPTKAYATMPKGITGNGVLGH